MSIFDTRRTRKPTDNGSNSTFEDLEDVRKEVPEVDSVLDAIDRALNSTMTTEPTKRSGCGCWD